MVRSLFLVVAFVMGAMSLQAQTTIKIGYTNTDFLVSKLPEQKQIEAELKSYETQLQSQLQSKVKDFEGKMETYRAGAAAMTDVIRADKERELQNLQNSIQQFSQDAEASMQKKQLELLQPAYTKVQNAIDQVAKDNGFTHILNTNVMSSPILLYADDQFDVSNLVLTKLGIATE